MPLLGCYAGGNLNKEGRKQRRRSTTTGLFRPRISEHLARGAPDASAANDRRVGDDCATAVGVGSVPVASAQAMTWNRDGVGIVSLSQSRTQPGVNSGAGPLVARKLADEEGLPSAWVRR